MSFSNVYYKRAVGTAKACYVCYKPTTTVLATISAADFVYTCPSHLGDRGFTTVLGKAEDGEKRKAEVTEEEIAKIKEEWEEKQRNKKEKEKEAKGKEEVQESETNKSKAKSDKDLGVPTSNKSTTQTSHERYALHRDFFAMRQAEHRKRRQAAQAKDLAPRLPSAPK